MQQGRAGQKKLIFSKKKQFQFILQVDFIFYKSTTYTFLWASKYSLFS